MPENNLCYNQLEDTVGAQQQQHSVLGAGALDVNGAEITPGDERLKKKQQNSLRW